MKILSILKSLSDLSRLRIISILTRESQVCNCDLEGVLSLNQSNASRHLTRLKKDELIICKKEGKWCYYSLNYKKIEKISFLKELLNSLNEEIYQEDYKRLLEFKKEKKCN